MKPTAPVVQYWECRPCSRLTRLVALDVPARECDKCGRSMGRVVFGTPSTRTITSTGIGGDA